MDEPYKIISAELAVTLESRVNEAISEGYLPLGNFQINTNNYTYYQAMYKNSRRKEPWD